MSKFKPGDVVKLKSDWYGNHVMTVGETRDGDTCGCVWFDREGDFCRNTFENETLELATQPNL